MPSNALQPFAPPASMLSYLPGAVPVNLFVMWIVYAVLCFWGIYSLIIIYHWMRYSHASRLTIPAIALHFFVSLALITFALSGTLLV